MQCVFQMDAQHDFDAPNIEKYLDRLQFDSQRPYVEEMLKQISTHQAEIDQLLNQHSQGWPTSRMAKTDLAIARLAVAEILFMDEVPAAVSVNEAVNLAKRYGTEQSPKFINAVLGKVSKAVLAQK